MSSTHADFNRVAGKPMDDPQMLEILRRQAPPAFLTLNGYMLEIDSECGFCRCRFEVVPAFCHSEGRICQGGFLTGMVDTAMAHAAIVKGRLAMAVPTLELKISFFEAMGPGFVIAEGRVMRWGGSIGFLEGDLRDERGRQIAHATSTIKIIRPKG
jgi:acyl-CoA thioesterase